MFNFNKNEQEKFNKKMNNVLEDLEKISYVEALARIAAFNKQSKTFEIRICSKKESRLENVIKNAGVMADETINKVKEKMPEIQEKAIKVTETIKEKVSNVINESQDNKEEENKIEIVRHKGDPWDNRQIATFLKEYINTYDFKTGKYDQEKKELMSERFSIDKSKLTNQANLFINRILFEGEYKEIFADSIVSKEEILKFKFRDISLCKELKDNENYKRLSQEDKLLLKEIIKNKKK